MYKGKPLFSHRVPRSGFEYNATLSWELACQWYGAYTREAFAALPGYEQARIVALYMVNNQMDAVIAKTMSDEAKQNG